MKMIEEQSMRDAFFDRLYDVAKKDLDIIMISADQGAPSLDKFRKEFSNRYFNVGIAEENMISIASGMASEGKKVYTYALAPFITSRCYEFTKLDAGLMKFPIKLIGVGAGFSYEESGPTHHTTEDISIMKTIPHLEIYSPSDSLSASNFFDLMNDSKNASYLRLDRSLISPTIHKNNDFSTGFEELVSGENICIVSTGNMVHSSLEVSKRMKDEGKNIGVIDLYRLKPVNKEPFVKAISNYSRIVSLEEHLLSGGLGSIISEIITDENLPLRLKRIGLEDYIYAYGGRGHIQKTCHIDEESIIKEIKKLN
jgi:transketolase